MSDLISRQDAIEVLSVMQGVFTEYGVRRGISMAWQQIKSLPPAQPEIIRCEDCDNYGTRWCMGYESFYGLKDDDYCSHAERKDNG